MARNVWTPTLTLPLAGGGSAPSLRYASQIEHEAGGILDHLFDPYEKHHRLAAVDEPMVVAQREIHHRTHFDLAPKCHRTLLDLVHAENARLRCVEDRRRHQ